MSNGLSFAQNLSQMGSIQNIFKVFQVLEKKYGGTYVLKCKYTKAGMEVDFGSDIDIHQEFLLILEKVEEIERLKEILGFEVSNPGSIRSEVWEDLNKRFNKLIDDVFK